MMRLVIHSDGRCEAILRKFKKIKAPNLDLLKTALNERGIDLPDKRYFLYEKGGSRVYTPDAEDLQKPYWAAGINGIYEYRTTDGITTSERVIRNVR